MSLISGFAHESIDLFFFLERKIFNAIAPTIKAIKIIEIIMIFKISKKYSFCKFMNYCGVESQKNKIIFYFYRNLIMKYYTHKYNNGIRLIHKHIPSKVAYCGLLVNTGSRDETEKEFGIAHFIEHTLFKGTDKRKSYHILNRMESVGGEIDAYTSKEETLIYGTFLNTYYDRFLELLSDIVFNSTFPQKELQKEKIIVYDEINSYLDTPNELIFDDFEELLYKGHPLSKSILGSQQSLENINTNHINNFIKKKYNTDNMVLCSIGDIDFDKVKAIADKYFNNINSNFRKFKRTKFNSYKPFSKKIVKNTHQAHCIIGNIAYSSVDNKRTGLNLLNNIIGGQGMNSRLNLSLREKHGLAYHVESSYNKYFDTGNWQVYFGTDKENLDFSIELVNKELKQVKNKKLGTLQLHRAKKQLIGQLAISVDNNANLFFTFSKSFLLYNKVDSLETVSEKINNITSEELLEIANKIFDSNKLSTLIYI